MRPMGNNRRGALAVSLVIALAGCHGDYVPDYRELYPIRVVAEPAALPVMFEPGRAELSAPEAARLDAFVAGYRANRSGPLTITGSPVSGGNELAVARARAVERRALAAGVAPGAVQRRLAAAALPAKVIVSYEHTVAEVPECGDWTKNTAADTTNTLSSNFGCATQRYIGLQAADPADLLRARADDGHDGQRTADVMQKFRTGRQTGSQAPAGAAMGSSFSVSQ